MEVVHHLHNQSCKREAALEPSVNAEKLPCDFEGGDDYTKPGHRAMKYYAGVEKDIISSKNAQSIFHDRKPQLCT
jgi:hypothetical protein